jgi:hypothetical protein
MRRAFSAVLVALALVAPTLAPAQATTQAQANAALRADPTIWNSLTALAIAREVGDRCPSIEARTLRGRTHVLSLYNHARGLGYSRQQIMTFIDDRAEKARLRTEVTAWFAARGLREGAAADGFCALGRTEISTGTLAGSFLRAR